MKIGVGIGQGGVQIDSRQLDQLLRSERGPAMRHMAVKANEVKGRARTRVGVSNPAMRSTSGGGGQHLRDTIVTRFVQGGRDPGYEVVAEAPHAEFHHEGTRPHTIVPVRARMLRFTTRGGQVVFARRVSHPGTRPNRFLVDAARDVGLNVKSLGGRGR